MRRTATPVSFSRSAMTGPSVWPSYGLPCSALACSTNCQRSGGRGNRHLAAELVRRASLAFVNALHLRCVQRVTDHAQLWIVGDAIGDACWRKGHAAGLTRKAPTEGKIRVDFSLNELLQLS